jgi:phospholipid transport system substrate-binding protein
VQPSVAQETAPDVLVAEVAGRLLTLLDENRELYMEKPEELVSVVTDELLPIFDLDRSARLILGRHGRGATPAQIKSFANAMSSLLSRRYAEGLLEFHSAEQLLVLPLKGNNSDRHTRVQTRVKLDAGGFAPVDYAFRKTDKGWKAFDVSVEGISYIITYRNQFGPQIQKDGLDAVIAKLENGDVELAE